MRLLANENAQMAGQLEERLRLEAPEIAITWLDDAGESRDPMADAEILFRFNMSNRALLTALQSAPHVQWVHTGSAGVERFIEMIRDNTPPDVLFTNSSGTMALPIAEFVVAQMFAAVKGLPTFVRAQDRQEWLSHTPTALPSMRELRGSRLLVLGLGSIGSEVVRLASALGVRVWGVRRTPLAEGETIPGTETVFAQDGDWRRVLPAMDFVAVCLPLTPATNELIGSTELAAMKPTAWLINISRGAIIDEPALIAALTKGRLGGAALDVMVREPLPPDHPLWACPNAVITPHVSWRAPEVDARTVDLFFENLHRYRTGEPLHNIVPFDIGY